MSEGACHPIHPEAPDAELFFDPERTGEAAAFCRTHCPVLADCAAFARALGVTDGIWGGVDMGQRSRRGR
ncbi:hypothetical protein GCG21_09040 [Pseudactinotalea sp. HY160]|nr:hypothetical protein [Pseudactinotalea sp. HY160]